MEVLTLIALRCQRMKQNIVSKLGTTIKFGQRVLNQIDHEVESGNYTSRSEFVLEAVTLHLDRMHRIDEIKAFLKSPEGRALIKEIQNEGIE